MYKITWDTETGGVLLSSTVSKETLGVSPRPVFYGKVGADCPLSAGKCDPFRRNKIDPRRRNKNAPCRNTPQGIFL